jgi:O-antigen ligase
VFGLGFLFAELLKVIRMKTFKLLILYIPLLAFMVAGINATGSRSGFGAMIFLFGIFLFRLSWKITIAVGTIVLINGFWLYHYIPRSFDIFDNFSTRVYIWKNSIQLILEYPQFGLTPLGFPDKYFYHTGHQAAHAHNIFLAIFADFGIIAGFVFIGLTAAVMFNFIKLLKYNRSKTLFDWFLFSMPILGLTGILDFPLSSPQIALPALILVSMWQQYIGRTNHSFKHWHALLRQKKVPDPS